MLNRYILYILPFLLVILLFGCSSGGYQIEKGNYKDTTYKSTGAKLKGAYKIRSAPSFTLQMDVSGNLGMAELSSNYSNNFDASQFTNGENFGVKSGFGVMVIGKIPLWKKSNLRLNVSTGFNRFQSDLLTSKSPFGRVSYNVMSLGAGIENSFSPELKIKPFLAGEIQANFISGKAAIVDQSTNTTRNVSIKNSFRIGYMVYSGLEFMLNNQWGLNFGLKVTNANQVLKKSENDPDPNEISLRDKKVDGDHIEFGGFKNFTYTSVFFGVNYYIGIKNILYKF